MYNSMTRDLSRPPPGSTTPPPKTAAPATGYTGAPQFTPTQTITGDTGWGMAPLGSGGGYPSSNLDPGYGGAGSLGAPQPKPSGNPAPVRRTTPTAGAAMQPTIQPYQPQALYPSDASGPAGMPTQQQDYYAGATQRLAGKPTASQAYYEAYYPSTYMQDYFQQRQANGYGPNVLQQRYDQRQAAGPDSQLDALLPQLQSWANSGSLTSGRLGERRNLGATETSGLLPELADLDPSQRSDAFARQLQGGESASGQMLADLRAGNSPTSDLYEYLLSGDSSLGGFLQGFDPTKTAALSDAYAKIAGAGPNYEEDFYTSSLTGDNPAYNQLKGDFVRDTQKSYAARGGFNSGEAMDFESRGLSRLAGEEYGRRGALAATAGGAKRESLGQQLTAAQALDQLLQGNNQLFANTALSQGNLLSGLATSREGNMTGLAGSTDALLAGLSQFGDQQGTTLADLRLRGAGQEDDLLAGRQGALDDLAISGDATDYNRKNLLAGTTGTRDANQIAREGQIDALATGTNASNFARETALDDLAGSAGAEKFQGQQLGGSLAAGADSSGMAIENLLSGAAGGASTEQRTNARDKFDSAMRIGDARSKIQTAYDAASIGALQAADIAALDAQLAALGVSAADRAATQKQLMELIKLAAQAKAGGGGGGSTYGDPDGSPETD